MSSKPTPLPSPVVDPKEGSYRAWNRETVGLVTARLCMERRTELPKTARLRAVSAGRQAKGPVRGSLAEPSEMRK